MKTIKTGEIYFNQFLNRPCKITSIKNNKARVQFSYFIGTGWKKKYFYIIYDLDRIIKEIFR